MTDLILLAVIGGIVLAAAWYVVRAKRSGAKCIGCPSGGCCSQAKDTPACCSCGGGEERGCCCGGGK